ncbi:MAG: Saccharopine dehydrogenase [Chaenotheca gracillima]|nr:MAG: Saccharopine dehydrogenase [Chaenotheca gracillima]
MASLGPAPRSSVTGDTTQLWGSHPGSFSFDAEPRYTATPPDLDQNFVFPPRAPSSPPTSFAFPGPSALRSTPSHVPRQSLSDRRASKRSSSTPLPAFNFSPAAEIEPTGADHGSSESVSQTIPIPVKPSAHRRRESEFVGGDGSNGGPGLMSTSPTKGEDALPVPRASRAGGRGGHRHRRSGAISVHDVPLAFKNSDANVTPRAGSAPTTPAANDPDFVPPSESAGWQTAPRPKSGGGAARARVGFSDTVEFIPRPLSTLSDETSSSLTTVLGGHSSSGSGSSDASAANVVHPAAIDARLSLGEGLPLRAASSRAGHGLSASVGSSSLKPREPVLSSSPTTSEPEDRSKSEWQNLPSTPIPVSYNTESTDSEPETLLEGKVVSKRRQVKSWAGSILPRKSKSRAEESKTRAKQTAGPENVQTSQMPAVQTGPLNDERPTRSMPSLDTNISSWTPRTSTSTQPSETMSPMIDLDAALGPFNTPNPGDRDEALASTKPWRMYSAKAGRFDSFDNSIHRRADSEPALPAFKKDQSNLHRLGSSSTMTDVIIEDDEDDEDERTEPSENEGNDDEDEAAAGVGIHVVDSDGPAAGLGMDWSVEEEGRDGRCFARGDHRGDVSLTEIRFAPSNDVPAADRRGEVDIVDGEEMPRADSVARSSDSTITPPLSPSIIPDKRVPSPVELNIPNPNYSSLTPETCSTLTMSTISSPDFPPGSFDFPPAIVPSSSFTNDPDLDSLMGGEPGPELRTSVDDVPSLTSSNSTMASGIHHYTGPDSHEVSPKERSMSVSSAVPIPRPRARRTRSSNRASLVSLTRLIHSSHGERSKLSIEEKAEPDAAEKTAKDKKGNRLSRLKFWKSSKETDAS